MTPIDALAKRLDEMREQYQDGTKRGAVAWQRRLVAHQSLLAVIEFIDAMPGWRGRDFALSDLLEGLTDIDAGRQVDWLSNVAPNRPPVSARVSILRARLAGVMEYLMQQGKSRKDAAQYVLDHVPDGLREDLFEKRTKPVWRTVAGWRDTARGEHDEGYETTVTILNDLAVGEADDRAKKMIGMLAKQRS